jgi:hypothetical protein
MKHLGRRPSCFIFFVINTHGRLRQPPRWMKMTRWSPGERLRQRLTV